MSNIVRRSAIRRKRVNPWLSFAVVRLRVVFSANKDRMCSFGWSLSVHLLLLTSLAMIGIVVDESVPKQILTAIASDDSSELVSLIVDDTNAEVENELDTMDVAFNPDIPELGNSLTDLSPQSILESDLDAPVAKEAELNLDQLSLGRDLGSLASDADRIAVTETRVSKAGGKLTGPIRISLAFNGDDDIDLHVKYQVLMPQAGRRDRLIPMLGTFAINFMWPRTADACLDVDSNADQIDPEPAENVVFTTVPEHGRYLVALHYFQARGAADPVPYVVVIKYGKRTKVFKGTLRLSDGMKTVWEFDFSS